MPPACHSLPCRRFATLKLPRCSVSLLCSMDSLTVCPPRACARGGSSCQKWPRRVSRPQAAKNSRAIFSRDMCVAKNTYQAASVEFVRRWRANYARSRLRSLCRKNPSVFPTVSSAAGMCPRRLGSIHIFILVAARRQEVRQPYQHILCLHAVVLLIRMQPQRDVEVPAQ